MPEIWFIYSISAALLWGFSYALSEHVLENGVSASTLLFIYTFLATPVYFLMAYKGGSFSKSLDKLAQSPKLSIFMLLIAVSYIVANFLIFKAVSEKNATLVSFVEISYPLFTMLFAFLLFREVQVNWGTALGGVFMILGSALIYRFSH